jgi:transaldolase
MPAEKVLREIDDQVDMATLERVLMEEGVRKFADPQKELLALIQHKR